MVLDSVVTGLFIRVVLSRGWVSEGVEVLGVIDPIVQSPRL
jgi:hypothetical protein